MSVTVHAPMENPEANGFLRSLPRLAPTITPTAGAGDAQPQQAGPLPPAHAGNGANQAGPPRTPAQVMNGILRGRR